MAIPRARLSQWVQNESMFSLLLALVLLNLPAATRLSRSWDHLPLLQCFKMSPGFSPLRWTIDDWRWGCKVDLQEDQEGKLLYGNCCFLVLIKSISRISESKLSWNLFHQYLRCFNAHSWFRLRNSERVVIKRLINVEQTWFWLLTQKKLLIGNPDRHLLDSEWAKTCF